MESDSDFYGNLEYEVDSSSEYISISEISSDSVNDFRTAPIITCSSSDGHLTITDVEEDETFLHDIINHITHNVCVRCRKRNTTPQFPNCIKCFQI
ncbi:hypothetical protein ABEB36_003599 [Hypothenemus hampei]|uniref:Uncharacterized protein n=1 Tax=Hypothenemus hampei TaxID=57062 RepID=A0ABD1F9R8_HYPHA